MRDLSEVLVTILAEIPETETTLRAQLESVRQRSLYGAPETQGTNWHLAARLLGARVAELMGDTSTPFPEWPEKTRCIFAGESQPSEVSEKTEDQQ